MAGQWVMPGGKIDHGESILAALHREVREEVGIEVHVQELIDVLDKSRRRAAHQPQLSMSN